jgi:sec-independent protein translocase protein TatA
MGLDNPLHILIFVVVLLLVFGAKRLPEIGKSLGEGMRGFKDSISGSGSDHTETLTPTASTPPAPVSVPAVEAPVVPPPAPPPAPTADHS